MPAFNNAIVFLAAAVYTILKKADFISNFAQMRVRVTAIQMNYFLTLS